MDQIPTPPSTLSDTSAASRVQAYRLSAPASALGTAFMFPPGTAASKAALARPVHPGSLHPGSVHPSAGGADQRRQSRFLHRAMAGDVLGRGPPGLGAEVA